MKCVKHPTEDAIGTCAKCGAGICNECFHHSEYALDGKPYCRSCNQAVMKELHASSLKEFISRTIKAAINAIFIGIGIWAYCSSGDMASVFFWLGLGGFPTAWGWMKPTLTDHVRTGVEQASGDWSGGIMYFIIRVVLSFVFGSVISPILMIFSAFKAVKAWFVMKHLKGELENFSEDIRC